MRTGREISRSAKWDESLSPGSYMTTWVLPHSSRADPGVRRTDLAAARIGPADALAFLSSDSVIYFTRHSETIIATGRGRAMPGHALMKEMHR